MIWLKVFFPVLGTYIGTYNKQILTKRCFSPVHNLKQHGVQAPPVHHDGAVGVALQDPWGQKGGMHYMWCIGAPHKGRQDDGP